MSQRHYRLELVVEGLLHIGNGSSYSGKEYYVMEGGTTKAGIVDMPLFSSRLEPDVLNDYCDFLIGSDSSKNLNCFIKRHPELESIVRSSFAYEVHTPFVRAPRNEKKYYDVQEFIKDSQLNPYVPGSSVKGMIRTAILSHIVRNNPESYIKLFDQAQKDRVLKDKVIIKRAFDVGIDGTNDDFNIMKYISVSDSAPLSTSDLVFAQKYDLFSEDDLAAHKRKMGRTSFGDYRDGNLLNIYKECLKPGTRISLQVDIDSQIDNYLCGEKLDKQGIGKIFNEWFQIYKDCFLNCFDTDDVKDESGGDGRCQYIIQSGPLKGSRCRNNAVDGTCFCNSHQSMVGTVENFDTGNDAVCYLGGGVDFDSKTIVNAIFLQDKARRVGEIAHILYGDCGFNTKLDYSLHRKLKKDVEDAGFLPDRFISKRKGKQRKNDPRHWMDIELGVSPHTMKYGIIDKKMLPMGRCKIQIAES